MIFFIVKSWVISNNSESFRKNIEEDGLSLFLTESTSSPSARMEEVGPGNPSGSWFPSYWQDRNLRVRDFHVFHYPLYIYIYTFFIALLLSLVFLFYKYLFFIERFPYYSATLLCLSFNFPILPIKRGRGEVDAVSSDTLFNWFSISPPREIPNYFYFSSRNLLSFLFFQFQGECLLLCNNKSSTKMYYTDWKKQLSVE